MSNIKVEILTTNDFDHICRTCSFDGELKSLFDNIETLSMLESLTQIQFSKTDELPDKICTNCLRKITECFHFINNCKIIDERLRRCQNASQTLFEVKTDELHSSIDIKQEEEAPETQTIAEACLIDDETENPENNENVKEIDVKQSEYYILKWGSPADNQENKHFQFAVVNNSVNEQDLVEQVALRRHQTTNRMRRHRARHHTAANQTEYDRKIPVLTQPNKTTDDLARRRAKQTIDDSALRRANLSNISDETHRARAKLTLPHEEQLNAIGRRPYETPERIALRRALAREQMRKYRNKLTADETSEHRAAVADNMRKYRDKIHQEEGLRARDYIRRYRVELVDEAPQIVGAPNLQIPLRLSEIAQTLLQPSDPLGERKSREIGRFSLRPTKIPQVKKMLTPALNENQQTLAKFRTWKRNINDTPDVVAVRLAKNALQMKRKYSSTREPAHEEESALRRAKAAGQLRQYRPVLRKNSPHLQIGK